MLNHIQEIAIRSLDYARNRHDVHGYYEVEDQGAFIQVDLFLTNPKTGNTERIQELHEKSYDITVDPRLQLTQLEASICNTINDIFEMDCNATKILLLL